MIEQRLADVSQRGPRRQEILPNVSRGQAVDQIGETVHNEQPGKQEVPAASDGKVLAAGQGRPTRKCAWRVSAGNLGHAQDTGGREISARELGDADKACVPLYRSNRQDGVIEVRLLADVEGRVSIEHLQP